MQTARTVLEQKIWERRQTLQEFTEWAEAFAREHNEPGTLSVRHLQRLVAGQTASGKPVGRPRPATMRLLEAIFGVGIDVLLTPPERDTAPEGAYTSRQPFLNVEAAPTSARRETTPAVQTPDARVDMAQSFAWLDARSGWSPDTTRRKVTSRLASLTADEVLDGPARRRKVGRSEIARAVADYYGTAETGHHFYNATCGDSEIRTSVLTCDRWLDLGCRLGRGNDKVALRTDKSVAQQVVTSDRAIDRLAEATAQGIRMANMPLYRLLHLEARTGAISAEVGTVPFIEYAVSMDLLENELIDALAAGEPDQLPLRDHYLPNLDSALNLSGRLCAGGVLALCAIARPKDPYRRERDFAIVVQQRSSHVLNAAQRLSVIPKGFHQPMTDLHADAQLTSTLLREMEEELFGRTDVDNTVEGTCAAAPLHPGRMSEPMRWLMADPSRVRMECTGFGLNLVSGNYEFACLLVIEDDEFWTRYGGEIEANWEASGLRLYSSLDQRLISDLIEDDLWSNEGVFALVQGIRRLRESSDRRNKLPMLKVKVGD
ncbi:transcriptional regulator [Saccharopolyspora mangrovi]|uniref:Transcriptional regulator n=1 Tax=Saccharopolyspora mangrovi TaxID=3082379 RepID=A0ABU6AGP7_9PSEU|nr:transcriptional regulator [Saccharopolyspora sp. S2-29]MEB3370500.1 transcriptional regulator [Saccharopolyspora sp. S2-29]